MFRQIIALCIIAYVVVATDKVNKEEKSATPEKTENKRALTRDVSKVAGKEAVAQAAPKAAGKEVVARDAVMSAEDYAEIGPNDRQIRKKRFRIRPRYWLRWHRRRPYYYYYYPYYPPAPVVPTTTTRSPYDDYYVYDEYCPNHADAFFTLRRYSLMFTGEDVFLIRGNTIEGVEFINEMFPAGPRTVTGAYYNDYKKMVVLFEGRNVWAYKHYPGPQFRLIAGYPKVSE
ncbi:unnamed protein product [Nippostrongylus brasiliensis]|uniref:Hemopexin n=1 Tax=Nippostrongylus brasiliensis TaxID=27835 RepID=A0A0N4XY70_NIPBR|nr:unnamed protein product [Nippostrongylus brasiliensis]